MHCQQPSDHVQVTEEVICPKLQELLFFMHSFLTAKVGLILIAIKIKIKIKIKILHFLNYFIELE